MTTKPRLSLSQTIVRTLGRNLFCVVGFGVAFLLVSLLPLRMEYAPPAEAPADVEAPVAAQLVEAHECWTGEVPKAMKGVIPGHVVVAKPGEGPVLGGPKLVGKALDQLFAGEAYGLTIYGFCR